MSHLFELSAYQFNLPEELIAQHPCEPRDSSRLMVIEKKSGHISEIIFRDIKHLLNKGDSLIFNNTKVIPARLYGKRSGGGTAEIFLSRRLSEHEWEVLARPGKKLPVGAIVKFGDDFACEVAEIYPTGTRKVKFLYSGSFDVLVDHYGQLPLPPYIKRAVDKENDEKSYQTVYAKHAGALAAPTAGLHFTTDLLADLTVKGITQTYVTLHTGLGTFKPVATEDIRQHKMHQEPFLISEQAADQLNDNQGGRNICVGTTCCRTLESASNDEGVIQAGEFSTDIFIYPGYKFKYVKHLLTNFHLPGSTLLMLVSAFAGKELIQEAYAKAIEKKFRFFSYGDAMLII